MRTFVFVLFLSPLHSALYNIPYFGIEISHVCSLIDLILCHYMYWADHYVSDCVMKYQVEDVSLSRINPFHTSPQDIGQIIFKTHHILPHLALHALPRLPTHLDCTDFNNREVRFKKISYLSDQSLDLGKLPLNLANLTIGSPVCLTLAFSCLFILICNFLSPIWHELANHF